MKCISRALLLFSLSLCLVAEAADLPFIVAQGLPGRLPGQPPPAPSKLAPSPSPAAAPGTPAACCEITAIDKAKGVVSARERASGRSIEFKVGNSALLRNMQVGQKVWLDNKTQMVSVEGGLNCCRLAPADSELGSTGSAATTAQKGTKSKSSRGGLDSIKPGELPTASEGSTAGAIRGRPETPGTRRGSGSLSSASENEDEQPDPAPRAAPPTAATAKSFNRATAKHVKDLQDVQKFFASLGHEVEKLSINVALVGGNKYMVNDCLGIKASAGQFTFRPGAPSLRLDGSGILMQFVVNRVSLDGLSVRVRPNVSNPAKLCKFGKRFGVGGSASNVRFEFRFDPLLDLRECRVHTVGGIRQSFAIGGFNLRPLQNDLDKVAKNMIEEAINLYLDGPSYQDLMLQATARALKTTCTGGL